MNSISTIISIFISFILFCRFCNFFSSYIKNLINYITIKFNSYNYNNKKFFFKLWSNFIISFYYGNFINYIITNSSWSYFSYWLLLRVEFWYRSQVKRSGKREGTRKIEFPPNWEYRIVSLALITVFVRLGSETVDWLTTLMVMIREGLLRNVVLFLNRALIIVRIVTK